uniref:F-box/WD repeat-containing protein 7 n=1 Tax=Aceria tosichella TaxID=561515 RepID=A0A6G1SBK2_9ACAR
MEAKPPPLSYSPIPGSSKRNESPPTKKMRLDVEQILDRIKSLDTQSQFELWRKMLTDHPFDIDQLKTLRTAIDNRFRVDIVSGVPYEIALYIMSFLSPEDLCQAAQTCRSWRVVCEDSRIWREKCREEGLMNDEHTMSTLFRDRISNRQKIHQKFAMKSVPASVGTSEWKLAYLKHMDILRNWKTRAFEITKPFISSSPAPQATKTEPTQPNRQHRQRSRSQLRQTYSPNSQPISMAVRPPCLKLEPQELQQNRMEGPPTPETSLSPNCDQETRQQLMQLRCHEDSVITCLQYNHLTNTVVSGSDDQTLKVWSSDTGKCIATLEGHSGGVWSSQLSPDDIVISGATDRTLKIWRAHTGELLHTLYGHSSTVRCLALNGDRVVSGSRDTTLRLWDIKRGECINVLAGHNHAVRCVEFKGDRIISGAYDHLVMVWDATTCDCLHILACHTARIYSLQFDGKTIASGSLDSTICIWDAETGKFRHKLMGHTSLTSKMQLKDNILVSANADSFCKVWDINTGDCLRTLGGPNKHLSAITSVYFDNRHVVTSSDDGTVKLWDIKTGNFIRNLIVLPTAANGGVVWRIRASYTKLICAVGSRSQTEDTHLLVLDFE